MTSSPALAPLPVAPSCVHWPHPAVHLPFELRHVNNFARASRAPVARTYQTVCVSSIVTTSHKTTASKQKVKIWDVSHISSGIFQSIAAFSDVSAERDVTVLPDGRVVVRRDDEESLVCGRGWSGVDGTVVCHQLDR